MSIIASHLPNMRPAGFVLAAALGLGPTAAGATVVINEYMASNAATIADQFGNHEDWIELYNTGAGAVDLEGWALSDDESEPLMWFFTAVEIPAGGHLLVWASGRDLRDSAGELHTNFSIAAAGEELLLSRPDGELADFVPPVAVPRDVSRGRQHDGSPEWVFFLEPTPGEPNRGGGFTELLHPPEFSVTGGFHNEPFLLELTAAGGKQVRYTLDGSTPQEDSPLYESPISVASRDGQPNAIARIKTVGDHYPWEDPPEQLFMGTVVRARTFGEGAYLSPAVTHTYFVGDGVEERYSLPVVSLATDNEHLFDEESGIFVPGVHYDPEATTPQGSNATGNFFQRGSEWERLASFELFEEDGTRALVQGVGIRNHGGVSRSYPRKSLRLYARPLKDEIESLFHYRFFEDSPADVYSKVLLRSGGQDWHFLLYRDSLTWAFLNGHTDLDFQYSRAAVVFINGEYWGVHHFRDRLDTDYLAHKYGLPADRFDLLTGRFGEVKEGTREQYDAFYSLITTADITDDGVFAGIATKMDVTNFIDYNIAQVYLGNQDWPHNNIDYWRYQADPDMPVPGEATPDDGRWRWIIYDIDASMGLSWSGQVDEPTLERATDTSLGSHNPRILSTLIDNPGFRTEFLNRFAGHLNTIFHPDTAISAINRLHDEIAPGMPEHVARWYWPVSMTAWERDAEIVRDYARDRPGHLFDHAVDFFSLSGTYNLQLATNDGDGGTVEVGHLALDGADLPWDGRYFREVPLRVRAVPTPGYRFAGWEGVGEKSAAEMELAPDNDVALVALFEKLDGPSLLHYWNFNNTAQLLQPTFTIGGGYLGILDAEATEVTFATGQGFAGENARFGDLAETHLRVNNPISAVMDFSVPTTGYADIVMQYETRRSGSGAGTQVISFTLDGEDYFPFGIVVTENADPVLETLDFSVIPGADDNPAFGVRIEFEEGAGADVGNNRFDNVTVEAFPLEGTNAPPVVVQPLTFERALQNQPAVYDLNEIFADPEDDPLSYTAQAVIRSSHDPAGTLPGGVEVDGSLLTINAPWSGEADVTVLADDGNNIPVPMVFRLLVYPEAHDLAAGDFIFDSWSPEQSENSFPPHMLFLQTDVTDPGLDAPLDFAYFVPAGEYHEDDAGSIGFPYALTRRTRLNALGDDGISFINTGRDRDLGGALLALDTSRVEEATVDFLAGTVLANDRLYAIRLQYRTDIAGPFEDLLDPVGAPIEYLRQGDGHEQPYEGIPLPEELLGHGYVQLLWRHYHIAVTMGPRAELRLDDIHVRAPREGGDLWMMY